MTDQLSGGVVQPTDAQLELLSQFVCLYFPDGDASTRLDAMNRIEAALAVPQAPLQAEPVPVVASEPTNPRQSAVQIVRNICETDPADPGDPDTILINVNDLRAVIDAALATPQAEPVRCPLCRYQYGHQIGCKNNPVDIALATPQAEPAVAEQARLDPPTLESELRFMHEQFPLEGYKGSTLWHRVEAALASQSTPEPAVAEQARPNIMKWEDRAKIADQDCNPKYWTDEFKRMHMAVEIDQLRAAMASQSTPPPESAGQGPSDAKRLDWLAPERGSRFLEREKGMFRVYEDVAMPEAPHHKWQACTPNWWPTAQQAIDGAILAANPTAQPDGGSKA